MGKFAVCCSVQIAFVLLLHGSVNSVRLFGGSRQLP